MQDPGGDSTTAPDSNSVIPKVFGIQLPKWAVAAISAIVVCSTAGSYGVKLYGDWMKAHVGDSQYSDAITKEMKAHENDTGKQTVLFSGSDGETLATYFSDGCIAISRPGPKLPYLPQGQSIVEWSLSPSRRPQSSPPDKPAPIWKPNATSGGPTTIPGIDVDQALDAKDRTLEEDRSDSSPALIASSIQNAPGMSPVQGSCVNPHAGPFSSWWGAANGCWAPFWRRWRDGCTHYQMYNTCSGQWDPQINWTFCAVQHYY